MVRKNFTKNSDPESLRLIAMAERVAAARLGSCLLAEGAGHIEGVTPLGGSLYSMANVIARKEMGLELPPR